MRRPISSLFLALFGLAACGDDGPGNADPGSTGGTVGPVDTTGPGATEGTADTTAGSDGTADSGSTTGEDDTPVPPPFGSAVWEDCYEESQCTEIMVPIDHEHASVGEIPLRLLRRSALEPEQRLGAIVVNVGGPGGLWNFNDAERVLGWMFDPTIRARYDVIYWHPRGATGSGGIDCQLEVSFRLDADPWPDTPEEEAALEALMQTVADTCARAGGPLLDHLGPFEHVHDLEWIRIAIGEEGLDYHGWSYGGVYGSLYAATYPDKLRRFVLDAPMSPDVSTVDWFNGSSRALQVWIADALAECSADPGCAFGSGDAEGAFATMVSGLEAAALPVSGGEEFGPQHLVAATLTLAFDAPAKVDFANSFIALLADLDGGTVEGAYNKAIKGDVYRGSPLYFGSVCQHAELPPPSEVDDLHEALEADGIFVGHMQANHVELCEYWQHGGDRMPGIPDFDPALPPGLLFGDYDDFEVPLAWTESLGAALPNSSLIHVTGGNHGSTTGTISTCIRDALHAYWIDGITPETNLECPRRDG